MVEKEFLNEDKYQKASKNLFRIGVGIIIFGVVLFMFIFIPNISNSGTADKEQLQQQLNQLKPALEERYAELKEQGVKESWDYKNKEGYEMYLIDEALNPATVVCEGSSMYSDHDTTREYCKVKRRLYDAESPSSSGGFLFSFIPALMALMPCLAIGGALIMTAKRRSIMAYTLQQTMPVAQEGIQKMAPTVGKAAASMAEEMAPTMEKIAPTIGRAKAKMAKEMGPAYGEIAKGIAKGIKEGLKDEDKNKDK